MLNYYSFSSLPHPAPPSLPLLLYSVCTHTMRMLFADEACLSMLCVCVFLMMLVFANEASEIQCVCVHVCLPVSACCAWHSMM